MSMVDARAFMASILALAATGCGPKAIEVEPPSPHVVQLRDKVDWEAAGSEAVDVLAGYLQTDTTNPPGNERRGADYLAAILEAEGFDWQIREYAPGRANLISRLPADDSQRTQPPLCLLSHIDVVTAEAEHWDHAPLSGEVHDGYLWGRGALDMKSLGAIELMTMLWLSRIDAPLNRDIILLAVADEEIDNQGARYLAKDWDDIGCSHLINEGGLGIRDAIFDGQTVFGISTNEKGLLWARMVATGEPGHGSSPYPDQSPDKLLDAVRTLRKKYKPRARIPPELSETLRTVGRHHGGFTGWVISHRLPANLLARPNLMGQPAAAPLLIDTLNLTGLGGALEPNVVPGRSWAVYDSRLKPETRPEQQLERLKRLTRKHDVTWEVIAMDPAAGSPREDPLFDALARYAVEGRTDAVAGPILAPGFTDSLLLRPLGVRAYGFAPFEVTTEEASTMHGHNERIPVDQVGIGLYKLFSAVAEVSVSPDP